MVDDNTQDYQEDFPTSAEIAGLREQIDEIDRQIIDLLQQRTGLSQQVGKIRRAESGPRLVLARERAVIEQYSTLGEDGEAIAKSILNLGRGYADPRLLEGNMLPS